MSQDLPYDVFQAVEKLGVAVKHDARASSLVGELMKLIKTTNESEDRIQKAVANAYVFDKAEINATMPATFLEFFVSSIARVGLCFEMARGSKIKDEDLAYLTARLTEATQGNFVASAAGIDIPSKAEIADREVVAGFEPMLDLVQRVLKVPTPERAAEERKMRLLKAKQEVLTSAEAMIARFDPTTEETFQRGIELKLQDALRRQEAQVAGVDPGKPHNPMFTNHEDELFFEIEMLRTQQRDGSPERQAVERAAEKVVALREEIVEIKRSIEPGQTEV